MINCLPAIHLPQNPLGSLKNKEIKLEMEMCENVLNSSNQDPEG